MRCAGTPLFIPPDCEYDLGDDVLKQGSGVAVCLGTERGFENWLGDWP